MADTSGDEDPLTAAVRNWGPSDRVYITVETVDFVADEVWAELYRYLCTGGASCGASLYGVGTWPKAVGATVSPAETLHTAMAISANGQNVEDVDIIRRDKIDDDCDGDSDETEVEEEALDLQNYDYHTDTNTVATRDLVSTNIGNTTNNACSDSGVSQLKNGAGALNACFTFQDDADGTGSGDRIQCNDDSGSPTYVWVNTVEMTSAVVEDHPAFHFKDGDRVVVGSHRNGSSNDDDIRFHLPDAGGSPEPNFDIALDADVSGGIYPDMARRSVSGGQNLYVVYEADGGSEIRIARCVAANDCDVVGDWGVADVYVSSGTVKHPELAIDGEFQMVVFEEDDEVYATNRCGTGTWSTPEIILTPGSGNLQNIWLANPHLVLNRIDNIAHVVLWESDFPVTSEIWMRKGYSDCP